MAAHTAEASNGNGSDFSSRTPIHLLIADDNSMGCQLLKDTFERSRAGFRIVDCAQSREHILSSLAEHPCDVALISESLSNGPLTGFQALRELRHSFPKTRSVMLLKSGKEELVVDAFRAGAKGVYSRTEPLRVLTKCILSVNQGQIWASSAQVDAVLNAFASAAPLRIDAGLGQALLTKRENDVVRLVIDGLSNREVAQKLCLTEHTVGNYLFRIYEKLGISSRVELVLYSVKS